MSAIADNRPPLVLMPEQCLTPAEAAQLLRVSVSTLDRLRKRGKLVSIGSGKLRRYTLAELRRYQEANRR